MKPTHHVPSDPIHPHGGVSSAFLHLGINRFDMAAQFVKNLPYGRNTTPDFRLVLKEGRGTCSTKHALLAQLSEELHLPYQLMIGIYQMNERNTPSVGSILMKHRLPYIPEAHCYLMIHQQRWDFTQANILTERPFDFLLFEEPIQPNQIGEYKQALHQSFLKKWLNQQKWAASLDFGTCWQIREDCISALTQH